MSDTKESMPAQPKTMELPKVDVPSMLTSLMADMKQVLSATDKMSSDVDMLISDGRKTNQRLTRVEERLDDFDGRLMRTSARVKEPSQHDVEIRAELVAERAAREALDKKVDIQGAKLKTIEEKTDAQTATLERIEGAVVGVIKNPKVIFVGKAVFALAMAYAAAKGIKVLP